MVNPYIKLWESVLIRLLLDSLGYPSPTMSESLYRIENNAKLWLRSKSFVDVCDLADKQPNYIMKIYDKIEKKENLEQDQAAKYLRFLLVSKR